MAVAPDGTAVAVWSQSGDGGPVVEAARRRPAQGWSAAIPVTAPGEQGRAPQVAIDAQDNATVVWVGAPDGPVRARGSPPRRPRSSRPTRCRTGRSRARRASPSARTGRRWSCSRRRRTAAGACSGPPSGPRGPRASATPRPSPTASAASTTLRATARRRTSASTRRAARWSPGPASTARASSCRRTSARRAARSPRAVRRAPPRRGVRPAPTRRSQSIPRAARRWRGRTTPTRPTPGTRRRCAGASACPARASPRRSRLDAPEPTAAPSLAAGADGTVVGAWVLGSGDDRRVQLAAKPRGQAFTGQREASPPGPFVRPAAHGDGAGAALVTWAGASDEAILSVRRSRGGAVGAVQQAANRAGAGDARDFSAPAVALDDEGNGTAVWTVTDHGDGGDVFHVQAAGHDAAAPEVFGVQVRPNPRATTAVPLSVAATAPVVAGQLRLELRRRRLRGGRRRPPRLARARAVHGRRDGHGRRRQRRRRRRATWSSARRRCAASARRSTRAGARLRPSASWCSRGSRSGGRRGAPSSGSAAAARAARCGA